MELIPECAQLFQRSGFTTDHIIVNGRDAVVFEDVTVIGFVFEYDDVPSLLSSWDADAEDTIRKYQFELRRAAVKAWNLYTIFLTIDSAEGSQPAALSVIEENLSGTRKIARSGIRNSLELRDALLALLPLQAAPEMAAVDIVDEIRQRATEIDPRVLEAFFAGSNDLAILQVLEDQP